MIKKCENPKTNPQHIIEEFEDSEEGLQHDNNIAADFEHGQWFITCLSCGAQWSVNDAEGRDGEYYQFDQVTVGDEYCYSQVD